MTIEIWLKFTTATNFTPSIGVFVGVFAAVSGLGVVCQNGSLAHILILIGPKSAIRLHEVLVKTTFNAPMSFFEYTDTSVLINRFSQDMSLVELPLPIAIRHLLKGKISD
jgi:ATP-binding cassette, subfamily C (CFTR/MRP), member 1